MASEFFKDDVDAFLEKSGLPISTKIRVPKVDECPDNCLEGWIVLYKYPFKIGYKLPLNFLMIQIMPLAWRVIHVIDKLTSNMNMEFGLEDM